MQKKTRQNRREINGIFLIFPRGGRLFQNTQFFFEKSSNTGHCVFLNCEPSEQDTLPSKMIHPRRAKTRTCPLKNLIHRGSPSVRFRPVGFARRLGHPSSPSVVRIVYVPLVPRYHRRGKSNTGRLSSKRKGHAFNHSSVSFISTRKSTSRDSRFEKTQRRRSRENQS